MHCVVRELNSVPLGVARRCPEWKVPHQRCAHGGFEAAALSRHYDDSEPQVGAVTVIHTPAI